MISICVNGDKPFHTVPGSARSKQPGCMLRHAAERYSAAFNACVNREHRGAHVHIIFSHGTSVETRTYMTVIMAAVWSKEETLKLIEIWGNGAILAQLEGCTRNQEVYDRIAAELCEAGYNWTGKQCREKVKKLRSEYRKVRDKRSKTQEGRFPESDYFDAIDAILGYKPAMQPPIP